MALDNYGTSRSPGYPILKSGKSIPDFYLSINIF